jgi:hypothetical protein
MESIKELKVIFVQHSSLETEKDDKTIHTLNNELFLQTRRAFHSKEDNPSCDVVLVLVSRVGCVLENRT